MKDEDRPSAHDTRLEHELAMATVACALAVLAGIAAERWLQLTDLSLVFMTAVIAVSTRTRQGVAVYAALLAALAYNYFFLAPQMEKPSFQPISYCASAAMRLASLRAYCVFLADSQPSM